MQYIYCTKYEQELSKDMYSETDAQIEKSLLLNILDLLFEKGLITENECNAMKTIVLEECR